MVPMIGKAEDIRLAVGLALPPYYLSEEQSGMELEIIKQALSYRGHTLTALFVPFARVIPSLASGFADAAAPANEASGYQVGYYSNPHITYKNIAVTLVSSGLDISSVNALANCSIVAFQNAKTYLSSDYADAVKNNPRYNEKSRQDLQIKMLVSHRAEVIVLDENIFKYYAVKQGIDYHAKMKIHPIFDSVAYKVVFNNERLMQDFNAGLAHIKQTGVYQQILDSYLTNDE